MTAIEFSFIPDAEIDYQMIMQLRSAFKRETGFELGALARKLGQDHNANLEALTTEAMDSLTQRRNLTLE